MLQKRPAKFLLDTVLELFAPVGHGGKDVLGSGIRSAHESPLKVSGKRVSDHKGMTQIGIIGYRVTDNPKRKLSPRRRRIAVATTFAENRLTDNFCAC